VRGKHYGDGWRDEETAIAGFEPTTGRRGPSDRVPATDSSRGPSGKVPATDPSRGPSGRVGATDPDAHVARLDVHVRRSDDVLDSSTWKVLALYAWTNPGRTEAGGRGRGTD
jgi:hypothetical protein